MADKKEKSVVELIINGEVANRSLRELEAAARKLRSELRGMSEDELAASPKKVKNLQQITAEIDKQKLAINGTSKAWEQFKRDIASTATGVIGGNMIMSLTSQITSIVPNAIRANSELSDSLADIRKTTGMTAAEVNEFNSALKKLNTRTAVTELRQIAITAGQLGISKKDMLDFVAATDKLNVALSDEFKGGAEEITATLGKLRTVLADSKTDKVGDDMLRLGNALNTLGQEGLATGPVVADFANRIGGVGIALGLSSGQVLGLSATLQELNVSTERGGTAISKILQKMTTNVSEFATIAGMGVGDFKNMLNNDLYGAFVKVVEGSQKSGASATAMANVLKDAELQGAGASEVFLKLGQNTEMLNVKVRVASDALRGTTSIMNEFNIKNETMGAKIDKIGKAINSWFTNSAVTETLTRWVDMIYKFVNVQESEQQVLYKTNDEINTRFAILKSGELTEENRVRYIRELNEKYGQYLPHLISEKASLEELNEIQKQTNNNILGKIILLDYEKEITELYKKQKDAAESNYKQQQKLAEIKTTTGNMTAQEIEAQKRLSEAVTGVNKSIITGTDKNAKAIEDKYSAMAASLGLKFKELQAAAGAAMGGGGKTPGEPGGTPVGGVSPEQQKEQEKIMKELLDLQKRAAQMKAEYDLKQKSADEQELQRIRDKYQKEIDEAIQFEQKKDQNSEQFRQVRLALEQQRDVELIAKKKEQEAKDEAEKIKLQDKMYLDTLNEHDRELAEVSNHYEKLILEAKKYGLDTTKVEEARNTALLAVDKKYRDKDLAAQRQLNKDRLEELARERQAEMQLVQQFGTAITNFNQMIGTQQGELTEFQRMLTLTQIAIDTAAAISSVTAKNAETSLTPIDYAIKVAAAIGTVFANMATAKTILGNAKQPQSPAFYEGGFTPKSSSDHDLVGGVHANEYVINAKNLRRPEVFNYALAMESYKRRGFEEGGFTSLPPANAGNATEMLTVLYEIKAALSANKPAVILWNENDTLSLRTKVSDQYALESKSIA